MILKLKTTIILCIFCLFDVIAAESKFPDIEMDDLDSLEITFSDVVPEDLDSLNMLMRKSKEYVGGSRYTKEYLDEFMEKLSFTPNLLKVSKAKSLFVNSKLAGFYSFYINPSNQLELDNFFIDVDFLYKGFGKILWQHCLETAAACYPDRTYFVLWSSLEGLSFYLKRGCIKIGEKPSPVDPKLVQPILKYNFSLLVKSSKVLGSEDKFENE